MSKTEAPEAYRIGWVPFINSKIYLDSRPLIPRTETEYWVNEVIHKIKQSGIKKPKVLDLCAGSGCIGVAVAQEIPESQVVFVELDPKHHENIKKNLLENNIDPSRTKILGGDLFERVEGKYDFILSNPPYIDMSLKRVAESVLEHEPSLALDGGQKGLEIIEKILEQLPRYLNAGGALFIEHEPEQKEELSKHKMYLNSYPDQYGEPRFTQFDFSSPIDKLRTDRTL